jgi:hypothetical protein
MDPNRQIRWFRFRTRRLRRYVIRTGPVRWGVAGVCVLVAAIGIYAYNRCYCTVAGRGEGEPVHLETTPDSCAVLNTPAAWQTPAGELRDRRKELSSTQYRDVFDNYELRQSHTSSLLFVALRSKPAVGYGGLPVTNGIRNSTNSFAFELHSSGDDVARRIVLQSLRPATQEEWDGADSLEFSLVGGPAAHSDSLSRPSLPPFVPVSNGAKWSARTFVWGGPKEGFFYNEIWYNPPTYASAVFYSSGNPFGEVRVWACANLWAFVRAAAIHANAYLTMPMSENQRRLLLCQIGPAPAKEVSAR